MASPLIQGIFLFQLFTYAICARILVVIPFPGKSHHMFATAIMDALTKKGHSIIEYSPFPPKNTTGNHAHHKIHTAFEEGIDKLTFDDLKREAFEFDSSIFGAKIARIWAMTDPICEDTFKDEKIQRLLQSGEKFDLVMTEAMFGQESLLVFGHIFGAPTVVLESFLPNCVVNWAAGNSLSIPSVPDVHSVTMDSEAMSFIERTLNFISTIWTLHLYYNKHLPTQELILRKSLPVALRDVPTPGHLLSNVSLFLLNSHPAAVNYRQPYTPNMVAVGGVNIGQGGEMLSQELQKFMDDAHDGAIYFSLGTVVPAHTIPNETMQTFTNVFRRLSQKVLWKIDLTRSDFPPNVKAVKWAPQIGVLEHPNCRLFITHGGLNSHQEAIMAGVPTVGIPLFADQPYNVRYAEHRGTGRFVPLPTLSETSLYEAISAVLKDPKYKENARLMSRIYNDRPHSPKDEAVYWVEYVLRHRGAPHLRPASASMPWYKLFLIDIIILTLAVVFVAALSLYKAFSFLCLLNLPGIRIIESKKIKLIKI